MAAHAYKYFRKPDFGRLGEIDNFGDVRQIVAREGDKVGAPAFEHLEIGAVVFDLQIDQLDLMSRLPYRLGDEFQPIGSRRRKIFE